LKLRAQHQIFSELPEIHFLGDFVIFKSIISILLVSLVNTLAFANGQIESSMVKIYTVQDKPFYSNPWDTEGPESISGSGVVISENRILTNAHVVSDNTFIQVRSYGKAKRYEADVLSISHESDLAILRAKDPSFYDGISPLKIGDLIEIQEPIIVCGFPTGGDTLSMTTGIVSRIEHQQYSHSLSDLLAIQIDAAMNPGNSGGPAISTDGKIVGISMQGISEADNIAYLIPSPIINHFLKDLADGENNGIPSLGIITQGIENPSLKAKKKMKLNMTGCLVNKVVDGCSADGYLREGDVLLKIGDYAIADDKTIEFRPNERTTYSYHIQQLQLGDSVKFEILRDGKIKTIQIPLNSRIGEGRLVEMQWDRSPTYYIYGGLVFNPLTTNYLLSWGDEFDVPANLLIYLTHNWKEKKDSQVVVLNKILPSELNVGYHDIYDKVVISINGNRINNMKDLISLIESDEDEFVDIKLANNRRIVLNKRKILDSNKNILERYNIQFDRSDDLVSK